AQVALARRPAEAAISEGNLAENPLFVLNNKDAKPPIGVDANGKPDLSLYTRVLSIGKTIDAGTEVERSVTLKANPQFGYPTMFAYRLLIAIIEEARRHDFASPTVYISRHALASRLGMKRPGHKEYKDIENALEAMRTLSLRFAETWYQKREGKRGSVQCDGLISSFRFVDDRQVALPFVQNEEASSKRSYVRMSDILFESLKNNYFHGVDLDYMNALKTPLAQRLYAYLAKKDNNRPSYSEDVRLLASKLNLKKRAPSAIWDALDPQSSSRADSGPLELLRRETEVEYSGQQLRTRRFLERWVADRKTNLLTVFFYDETRAEVELSLDIAKQRRIAAR
ncbi:MAG: replication initiator protein A, partial [Myxococcaceae bacterium]